jgi:hypothetical protein
MTSLFRIFVEAMEAERARYAIGGDVFKSAVWLRVDRYGRIGKEDLCKGTRADCERFVAERAARAGFVALRDHYQDSFPEKVLGSQKQDEVYAFLNELAGEHDDS